MTSAELDRIEKAKAVGLAWLVGGAAVITGLAILLGAAGILLGAGISIFVLLLIVTIEGTK